MKQKETVTKQLGVPHFLQLICLQTNSGLYQSGTKTGKLLNLFDGWFLQSGNHVQTP